MAFARRRRTTDPPPPAGAPDDAPETGRESLYAGGTAAFADRPVAAPRTPRGAFAIPRTRGMLGGFLILILGIWGGIVAFVGPYFHYAYINYHGFSFPTYGRLWLNILPGALAVLAGLVLMWTRNRATATLAAMLAVLAGGWFVVGPSVSMLWNHGVSQTGSPLGSTVVRTLVELGYFYALGAAIVLLAAVVLGRVGVKSVRDVRAAERRSVEPAEPPVAVG